MRDGRATLLGLAVQPLPQRLADLWVGVVLDRQPAGEGNLGADDAGRQASDDRVEVQ